MNNKGSITDIVQLAAIAFVFCVVILIGYTIYANFNSEVQANTDLPTDAKDASDKMEAHFSGVLDNAVLFVVFGLGIVAFTLAALVRVHPVFLFLYFIVLLVVVIVCGALSNAYQEMAASDQLAPYAANLGVSMAIMTYLPMIVGVLGTLLAIVMYKSWRENAA